MEEVAFNQDHQELILAGKQGDESALTQLIELYAPFVHRLIFSIVRDDSVVEDLAQDAFIKMLTAIENYEFRAPFKSWLTRIAVNVCRDHLRKKKVRSIINFFKVNEETNEEQSFMDEAPNPVMLLEKDERKKILLRAMERLPASSRMILVLRELNQLSYEEIAAALGWKMGTVKSRLFRARQELLQELAPYREDLL
ncbi:MAG: RNA polymerase sigma factor [candidate division KSB1 bacterium]|nr:RNA polymerase sigma factor [candidate division KSB1 bacterium]